MNTIEVKRGTELHRRITKAVVARKELSENQMRDAHTRWNKNEDDFVAYIPKSDKEKKDELARDQGGELSYQKVVVPYNYSMLMTAHTYFASTMLARDPIFQYTGAHGESEMNVHAVEALTAYQMRHDSNTATMYLWTMDVAKYGLGVVCNYWDEEMNYVSEIEEVPVTFAGMEIPGRTKKVRRIKEIPGYAGNKLFNVSPYDYIPDTRVPLGQPNKGEFAGRKLKLAFNDITLGKLNGKYIEENAEYILERMQNGGTDDGQEDYHSARVTEPGENNYLSGTDPKTGLNAQIPAIEMVVEIIPKLWGLGESEYPEKWVFVMTDDKNREVLLSVRPFGMYHNRFPYHILEMEMDAYNLIKRSMLDIARPLNEVMTWLFNSHFYSVSRSLNGEIIFDPTRVYAADIYDRKPGKRIRLRPSAYGTDVRTAIHSLAPDSSVTQPNLQNMGAVMELMQQALGVNEGMLGNLPSGRQSATASRIATSASTSRLKTIVDYFSVTGFQSLAMNMLQTAQQLYDANQKFRIAGDLPNNVSTFTEVTPDMIAGSYDYVPVDGSMPVDRVATVNMWAQLLNQFRAYPQLAAQYDVGKIIGWIMQQGGIRNLKQFQVEAQSPEQIAAELAKGNLIPIGGPNADQLGGAGGYGGPSGTEEDLERDSAQVPNPGQSGGMGRTV